MRDWYKEHNTQITLKAGAHPTHKHTATTHKTQEGSKPSMQHHQKIYNKPEAHTLQKMNLLTLRAHATFAK